jgi:hypothetical protein
MNTRYTLDVLRSVYGDKQTLGSFILLDNNNPIFSGYTLELPWKNNEKRVSCIPVGEYLAIRHKSPKHGWSFWLQDVPERSEILVHKGNYYTDILGCLLIGKAVIDINGDGLLDVTNSKNAVEKLMEMVEEDQLTIFIHD